MVYGSRRLIRATYVPVAWCVAFAFIRTAQADAAQPAVVVESPSSSCESWPARLAAPARVCTGQSCAVQAVASSCDAAAPLCREIDCGDCAAAQPSCDDRKECPPRACVLCVSATDEGALESACMASTSPPPIAPSGVVAAATSADAVNVMAVPSPPAPPPSWALYEVKDQLLVLVTSSSREAQEDASRPSTATPRVLPRLTPLRERVGGMGMLALIRAAPRNGDLAVASIFRAGASVDDNLRAALLGPSLGLETLLVERRAAAPVVPLDVVPLLTFGEVPPAGEPRAVTVQARVPFTSSDRDDDRLDVERATQTLKRHRGPFERCYAASLHRDPSLRATLVVDVTVDSQGRVTRSDVVRQNGSAQRLTACVLETLADVRFRDRRDGEVVMTTTFVFQPEESATSSWGDARSP